MKNGKYLFLPIIFLVGLLCISAVGAADDAASDIVAESIDEAVLEESIDDADLVDSQGEELTQSDENVLSDDGGSPPSPPPNTSFGILNDKINGEVAVDEVNLSSNYSYQYTIDYGLKEGITINRTLTINGNGYTLNGNNMARIFNIQKGNVIFKNINFVNGNTSECGGAIYVYMGNCTVIDCTFINNSAGKYGGAIEIPDPEAGTAINCNFINNSATYGGAIHNGYVNNCKFITNNATKQGGAMYNSIAEYCSFNNNSANLTGGAAFNVHAYFCNFTQNTAGFDFAIDANGGAMYGGVAVNCSFTGNVANNKGGAIYNVFADYCTFSDNRAVYDGGAMYGYIADYCIFTGNRAEYGNGGAIYNGDALNCVLNGNSAEGNGGAMYGAAAVNSTFNDNLAHHYGGAICNGSATNCKFKGNIAQNGFDPIGDAGNAMYGKVADSCVFNGDSYVDVEIIQPVLDVSFFTSDYGDGSKLLIDLKTGGLGMPIYDANIKIDVYDLADVFVGTYNVLSGGWIVPLNAGSYIAIYNATDFDIDTVMGMIVVNQVKSQITSQAVSTIYNKNKYLVITLKDNKNKPIIGGEVTVALAGAKTYKTDKNGQIRINVGTLVPKSYVAKIRFAGSTNFYASSTDVDVIVKKAAVKMTAKKKTFKVKVKTKKYTITLKNNIKKAIKGAKVTLKVNKKTYKAKTNKKGKAVFKIKNLKKKGTYKAVIKFAGNKYYKKVTKKVKIRVKK